MMSTSYQSTSTLFGVNDGGKLEHLSRVGSAVCAVSKPVVPPAVIPAAASLPVSAPPQSPLLMEGFQLLDWALERLLERSHQQQPDDHWTDDRRARAAGWIMEIRIAVANNLGRMIVASLGALMECVCRRKPSDDNRRLLDYPYNPQEFGNWRNIRDWRNGILHEGSGPDPTVVHSSLRSMGVLLDGLDQLKVPPVPEDVKRRRLDQQIK